MHGYRFLVAVCISILLMFSDWRFEQVDILRKSIDQVLAPVRWLVSLPNDIDDWSENALKSREELAAINMQLEAEVLVLKGYLQKKNFLELENKRMRNLLSASHIFNERLQLAEITAIDSDPYTQHVIINKGSRDGVYVGQSVLDSDGVMGQVIEVSLFTARVLLIADANHAIPVQINRNGVRGIAAGNGSTSYLELHWIPSTSDIVIGDVIVTSGLGGRFPQGYPVGTVESIEAIAGEAFPFIKITPFAKLDRTRHVLLIDIEQAEQIEQEINDGP